MGAYSSNFVIEPESELAISGFTHPSKPNWITAHAISTELSIAEVERLWLRFQQMGANKDGVLTKEALDSPKLSAHVIIKNILKSFRSTDGNISFESFLRAVKWCENQNIMVKVKAIFRLLNNGNPIPKETFKKFIEHIYPDENEEHAQKSTNIFFRMLDKAGTGYLEENNFLSLVLRLPPEKTNTILNFHILPEEMRDNVHKNLPEFSSQAGFYSSPTPFASQVPSDIILREVAEKIHRKDWDLVANRLGFFSNDIKTIRSKNPDNTYDQALQMLMSWKAREGDNASANTLEKILRNAGMIEASLLLAP